MTQPPRRGRTGRIVRRVLAGLLALVLVALVGGYWYARPLLLTGTGYAAHNACAVEFVTGRDDPQTDLPPNPLVPYLDTTTEKLGTDGGMASSSIKGLLAGQKAWFTPGLGCVVAKEKGEYGTVTAVPAGKNPYTSTPAPTMRPDVSEAIAKAFGDDLDEAGRKTLGTRAIVVLRGGTLVGERYADGFDATTPQLGWSMTKSVAVLMAGRLAQEGKLNVTDKGLMSQWTDGRADITVDQLMRMTSGIQWDETYDLGTPIT
ncbi:MAG TPA: serine hydrolase, partial [Phycicoccus sp.]|nr:serine hydrolase [Phycicoccus sp.]